MASKLGVNSGGSEDRKAPSKKLGVRTVKGSGTDSSGETGEAVEQNRATQFGYGNKSTQTTGNKNYKSPGSAGGMT